MAVVRARFVSTQERYGACAQSVRVVELDSSCPEKVSRHLIYKVEACASTNMAALRAFMEAVASSAP